MTDPQFIRIETAAPRPASAPRPCSRLDSLLERHARGVLAAVALITLLGASVRLQDLGTQALWFDEIVESTIARGPARDIISGLWQWENEVPFDYFLLHLTFSLGGFSETTARLPAALLGTLTIPLLFLLGRALWGSSVGLVACALLAVSPFHRAYSQEARPYALLLFLATATSLALWRLAEGRGRRAGWWAAYVGLSLVSVWTHLSAVLTVAVQQAWIITVWILAVWRRDPEARRLRAVAAGSLGVAALCAVSLILVLGRTSNTSGAAPFLEFGGIAMREVLTIAGGMTFGSDDLTASGWAGTVGLAAVIAGLIIGFVRCSRAAGLSALLSLGVIGLIVALCWHSNHWFSLRYAMPAVAGVLLLEAVAAVAVVELAAWIAGGIVPRATREGIAVGLLAGALTALTLAGGGHLLRNQSRKVDWPRMIEWFQTEAPADVNLITPDTISAFEFNFYASETGSPLQLQLVSSPEAFMAQVESSANTIVIAGQHLKFQSAWSGLWGLPALPVGVEGIDILGSGRDLDAWAAESTPRILRATQGFEEGGRHLDVGEEAFTATGPGWGFPERFNEEFSFRWSASRRAGVTVPLERARDLHLAFRATTFTWPGAPAQLAKVWVNGRAVAFGAIIPDWHVYGALCSAEVWRAGVNVVEFEIDHTASPLEAVGSADTRQLGIGLDWIELFEGRERPTVVEHDWTGAAIPEAL